MFLIFSLPRSRSAWLSAFLGREARVGHDIGVECATPDEYLSRLKGLSGSCETGAAFAWRLLKRELPDAKFAVVLRSPAEVAASLERQGLKGQGPEMERRFEDLLELAAEPNVLAVQYGALGEFDVCRAVYQHCLDKPLDAEWWAQLSGLNIQLDMAQRLARLAVNVERIEGLKTAVRQRVAKPGLVVEPEGWSARLWEEMEPLSRASFDEVEADLIEGRGFDPDVQRIGQSANAGLLRIFTARRDGKLVGYLTWQLGPDMESRGALIAHQGAWYVPPGQPKAALRLFQVSLAELKAMGVRIAYPHHPRDGRGADLGRFFGRLGAREIQRTYCLSLEG